MTLDEIEAFLAVVQTGSITAGARSLNVTQPTLSRRIDALEAELGTQLVERGRGRRTAELTEVGRALVPVAQKWVHLWNETEGVVQRGGVGVFSVGAIQTLCSYVMPRALARFVGRGLPQQVSVRTLHSDEAYDAVESAQVDAALVTNTRYSELVTAVPVFDDPMVLVCAPDAPYRDGVGPGELEARLAVNLQSSHGYRLWYTYWFGAYDQAVLIDNFALAQEVLRLPGYWCMAPLSAAQGSAATCGLRIVRIKDAPPKRTVYMLTRGTAGPLAEMLADDVRAAAAEAIGDEMGAPGAAAAPGAPGAVLGAPGTAAASGAVAASGTPAPRIGATLPRATTA